MLKGRAVISLRDVNTGKTETYEEKNLVTGAIDSVINTNIEGLNYPVGGTGTNWDGNILPICPNAIGGVLLFSDPIEERVDNLYAPSSNPCVGYASNDVNGTAEVKRGSLNLTESKRIEKGYKFVWDFTTSQANGPISCIALTHKFGGMSYFGDMTSSKDKLFLAKRMSNSIPRTDYEKYANVVEVNFIKNYIISMAVKEDGDINIKKFRKSLTSLGLNYSCKENDEDLLEERNITPSIFVKGDMSYSYDFYDGYDGYFYGFWNKYNTEGDGNIKWIKINKLDYSFIEGEWTIANAKLFHIASRYPLGGGYSRVIYSVLKNGYLYIRDYASEGLYKINIENPADTVYIPFGFKSKFSCGSGSGLYLYVLGDYICGSDFVINSYDEVISILEYKELHYIRTPLFSYGTYLYAFGPYVSGGWNSYEYLYKILYILTPYLATINNLSTPVMKTADKTMKITYFLEEV